MNRLLSRLKQEFPFLHERAATENDFHNVCDRHSVEVVYTSDISTGLYVLCAERQVIFLNSSLRDLRLRHVMFHELAHFLFHVPSQSNVAFEFFDGHSKNKNHCEAEAAAAWLLVPISEIDETPLHFQCSDNESLRSLVSTRLKLHETYSI